MKERIFVFGNCQSEWLYQRLRHTPALKERFEFIYQASFGETPADHPIYTEGFLDSCSVVIWQTASNAKPPTFVQSLRKECRQIRFPTLWLKVLWPFHCDDPRNKPEPRLQFGPCPYGDRLAMRLLEQGATETDLTERYLNYDVAKLINLDRFAQISFAEIELNDRNSDFAILPHLEKAFRDRRLFATVNHPTEGLLNVVYRNVLSLLVDGCRPETIERVDFEQEPFGDVEIPVHPKIAEHFKLTWYRADLRYRFRSKFLTLNEWLKAYATLEPIHEGNPPVIWLQRAEQARASGDFGEARRLLLTGAALFPGLHHFHRFLGVLCCETGDLAQAEWAYTEAIQKFPSEVGLHLEFAKFLARQERLEEAERVLALAAQNAPNNREVLLNRSFVRQALANRARRLQAC